MDEKEWNNLKEHLLQEISISEENRENFGQLLEKSIKNNNDDHHLSIKIRGDDAKLTRYSISFDFFKALQLLVLFTTTKKLSFSISDGIIAILEVILILAGIEKTNLDDLQIMIIKVLYDNKSQNERAFLEEDLYGRIKKQGTDMELSERKFQKALNNLVELKCLKIVNGTVNLVERVVY